MHSRRNIVEYTLAANMPEAWSLPRTGTVEDPLRLAVLISGSGSGMESLISHQQKRDCSHVTNVVISDRIDAGGLAKAEALGVTAVAVPLPDIEDREQRRIAHEKEVGEVLADYGVEVVILSGTCAY